MNPPLHEEKINYALVDSYWRVKVFDEIDSTQSYLASLSSSLRHGDVAVAEYQSAGRGRADRSFEALKSVSLLFSFYYQPKRHRDEWGAIALIIGTSIAKILGDGYSTKWPNDVLHATGKVSGTLCEFASDGVIVGIGINTAMTADQLPVPTATSTLIANGQVPDRNELLVTLLNEIAERLAEWESGADFRDGYLARSATCGTLVRALLPGGDIKEATAVGVTERGELVLDSGEQVSVGDITHLK